MKYLPFSWLGSAALVLATATASHSEDLPAPRQARALKVAFVFDDQMVLKRGLKTPVWGWNKRGTTVTVALLSVKEWRI